VQINKETGKEDSLNKRYAYSLFANIIGLAASMVTAVFIPRGLGPVSYGNFSFLTNFFQQLIVFLGLGTPNAFYTKLSQRSDEHKLISFYVYISLGLVGIVAVFLIVSTTSSSFKEFLWPGQQRLFIYAAALLSLGIWFSDSIKNLTNVYALTAEAEIARIFQRIISVGFILLLFLGQWLTLFALFIYHYLITFFLCILWVRILFGKGYSLWGGKPTTDEIRGYLLEFYKYCGPLVIGGIVGLPAGLFDRWLLQKFGGSAQQGFYSLSYQIGTICILFTSALVPLITREFSVAFGRKDLAQMAFLFRRYIPLLYSIAAYFSCFIALQADKVIYITGGQRYAGAAMAVTIMAFYPIHQTYGQLSASVFLATGQTALYRNIGVFFVLFGLPLTYFLIAPGDKMGLNAGATGLAIKMVIVQFIGVNVQLYFNARLLDLRFWRYVGHQIVSVACLLGSATAVMLMVDVWMGLNDNIILSFFLSGILYTLMVMGVAWFQPILFGLRIQDRNAFVKFALRKIKKC